MGCSLPRQGDGCQARTLDRLLSKYGLGSRAQARAWVRAGRVTVNGKPVRDPGCWVDPRRDRIALDGQPVTRQPKIYLILNKPAGYITTRHDPAGRPTVYDLIGDLKQWVAPAGRLDADSSGLLVLTNDTSFADRLTDPRSKVPKTYRVLTSSRLSDEQLERLRAGVQLKDGPARPLKVRRLEDRGRRTLLEITLTEGRNREVRRMLWAVGARVVRLERVAIGSLRLHDLEPGCYRHLTAAELRALLAPARP